MSKYRVRICYDEKGSNIDYTTDTNKEQLREGLVKALNDDVPLIIDNPEYTVILNPNKIIFIEIKELKQDD